MKVQLALRRPQRDPSTLEINSHGLDGIPWHKQQWVGWQMIECPLPRKASILLQRLAMTCSGIELLQERPRQGLKSRLAIFRPGRVEAQPWLVEVEMLETELLELVRS
jgi:hypothetical protein